MLSLENLLWQFSFFLLLLILFVGGGYQPTLNHTLYTLWTDVNQLIKNIQYILKDTHFEVSDRLFYKKREAQKDVDLFSTGLHRLNDPQFCSLKQLCHNVVLGYHFNDNVTGRWENARLKICYTMPFTMYVQ